MLNIFLVDETFIEAFLAFLSLAAEIDNIIQDGMSSMIVLQLYSFKDDREEVFNWGDKGIVGLIIDSFMSEDLLKNKIICLQISQ